jgi:P27 family predicted phage terminase small subunit
MAKPGPTPKPTALRVLEGNQGKRPMPENEPEVPPLRSVPKPPTFLMPAAKKHWKIEGEKLLAVGLLTEIDLDAFAAYCNAYAGWVDAQRQLKMTGMLVRSPNGYPMPSPWINISEKALDRLLRYQKEFGLTPSARSRVEVDKDEGGGDVLDDLIRGKHAG